ncbi:MAG: hypothetical protein U1F76_14370 [Candidatus Competibacteraceae bacterium]
MSNYKGFFVRTNLGHTPDSGQDGWCWSPDIILAGTSAASESQLKEYVSDTGYAKDYGSDIFMQQINFVYLRALNTASDPLTGRAWLFHAENNLALTPDKWLAANIQVGRQTMNYMPIKATAANQKCVTADFQWTPQPFIIQGSHYCMIAWIENPPVSRPPVSPILGIPNINTWKELTDFVVTHPNMGWRNTRAISADTPDLQVSVPITAPPGGGQVLVGVRCNNLPAEDNAYIQYQVPGVINQTKPIPIYDPNMAPTVPVKWPKNTNSTMVISYHQGNTKPPSGSSFSPIVVLSSQQARSLTLQAAQKNMPYRLATVQVINFDSRKQRGALGSPLLTSTMTGIITGSFSYVFK